MKQNLSSNQLANRQSKTDLVGQNLINTPGKRKGDAFMYGEPVQMENMRRLKNEETVSRLHCLIISAQVATNAEEARRPSVAFICLVCSD